MEDSYIFDITTKEGNSYSIQLDLYDIEQYDLYLDVDVYSVTLFPNELKSEINGFHSLLAIANVLWEFVLLHDVILFYYCDVHDDIFERMNKRRRNYITRPQHYRSLIFDRLFERINSTRDDIGLVNKPIVFVQEEFDVAHYMNIITRKKNLNKYDDIELTLYEYANELKGKEELVYPEIE